MDSTLLESGTLAEGDDVPARVDERPTTIAGRFVVTRPLGRGGMGAVYLARDTRLGRDVAIKMLHLGEPGTAAREQWFGLFEQEARSTARLKHRAILTLHDYGVDGGEPYLVLEFLRGQTLADRLGEGPLAPRRVLELARELAGGLAHAHALGVVHRDLKPDNLFLESGGQLKVMDFGIALLGRGDGSPRVAGTPGYMAPEQRTGGEQTSGTDVWAYGVVLLEMLTGERATQPARLLGVVDREWAALIADCLDDDPSRRPDLAGDVPAMLDAIDATLHPRSAPTPPDERSRAHVEAPEGIFFGRDDDLDHCSALLADGERLVSILGPAGTGKTHFARALAFREQERWGHVAFCDLVPVTSRDEWVQAVAGVLDVGLEAGDAEAQVGVALANRGPMLLVLDNVEQLVDAAELVEVWLRAAPELVVIVTSRHRLGLSSEHPFVLDTLALPASDTPGAVAASAAVQCLAAAAGRHGVTLSVDDDGAVHVAALVRALDGLPLALHLAAPRLRMLSPEAMLQRLDQRFGLLRSRQRGNDGRHAALHSALSDAWDHLDACEADVLAQCSVFDGGFFLRSAEEVVDVSAHPGAPFVLDVLESLVDKSLVRVVGTAAAGEPRFELLVSIRDFAREIHEQTLEHAAGTAGRHAAHFAEHGSEAAWSQRYVPGGAWERESLFAEVANVVAACRWGANHADAEGAALLVGAVACLVASEHGYMSADLAQELTEELVPRAAEGTGEYAWMRACLGALLTTRSQFDLAIEMLRESVQLIDEVKSAFRQTLICCWAWGPALPAAENATALQRMEAIASGSVPSATNHTRRLASAALAIGAIGDGDLASASARAQELLEGVAPQAIGNVEFTALHIMAVIAHREERQDEALRCVETIIEFGDRTAHPTKTYRVLRATWLVGYGRYDEARPALDEAIDEARRDGATRRLVESLSGRAMIANREQAHADALSFAREGLGVARAAGAARLELRLLTELGVARSAIEGPRAGEEEFARALALAENLNPEDLAHLLSAAIESATDASALAWVAERLERLDAGSDGSYSEQLQKLVRRLEQRQTRAPST